MMTSAGMEPWSIFFAFAAAALSTVLVVRSAGTRGLPGCGTGSACDAVTKGRWSRIVHIPVLLLGAVAYSVFALSSPMIAYRIGRSGELELAVTIHTALAGLILGAAAWFLLLQGLVIRRWCLLCLAIHALGVAAALTASGEKDGAACYEQHTWLIAGAAGLCLAVVQTIFPAKLVGWVQTQPCDADVNGQPYSSLGVEGFAAGMPASSGTKLAAPPVSRPVRLSGGLVGLNAAEWPLIGSTDAREIIAILLDFTCKTCCTLLHLMVKAVELHPGDLAVLVVPVPLHPDCNADVKCRAEEQALACQYARLAFAVQSAGSGLFQEWSQFLARSSEGEPFGLALLKASELTGIGLSELKQQGSGLDARIAQAVEVRRRSQMPAIPAILLRSGLIHGQIKSVGELLELLAKHGPL